MISYLWKFWSILYMSILGWFSPLKFPMHWELNQWTTIFCYKTDKYIYCRKGHYLKTTLLKFLMVCFLWIHKGSCFILTCAVFSTEPLACDPSTLPKYPPTKEMDAKRRDDEARRSVASIIYMLYDWPKCHEKLCI